MPQDAYITPLGRSTWALVNTYYAVLRERGLRPERVYIIVERPYAKNAGTAKEAISIISEAFGSAPEIFLELVEEADFVGAGRTVGSLVERLAGEGFSIALDITSGRKATIAGALAAVAAGGTEIRHIYYLAMKSVEDIAKPYMMIPLRLQEIRDFTQDARRGDSP
ncbi:hypothetical protein ABH15_08495 [Methanoculleus taiwanensis]|uniref:CRISPR-associated protein n=2 Tax=Methanoculleus taiwanensis TaxID=1550565 RepID=A0A498H0V2_9EURY|nr:hypothetical protein ABH15_08495 [Methanoculleus taiwanensis]